MPTTRSLSLERTERNTVPSTGNSKPADINALAKAMGAARCSPITSPVDRISGPKSTSTPGKRSNGNTGAFTAK